MNTLKPAPKWPDDLVRDNPLTLPKAKPGIKPWDLIRLDTVTPIEVDWLWYPYMPRGRVTSVEGDPGVGKSWFTCGLAAAISKGMKLPGMDKPFKPGNVLMLSVEDGLADTVVPRLIALDADLKRISVPNSAMVLDGDGMGRLEASIKATKAQFVVIDPVQFFMGSKTDMNTANQVRGFTAPLALVAERTDTAVAIVRHMRKANGDGKAIYAGLGSIDFAASVRSILQVEEGEGDMRFVNHIKSNNAKKGLSITFSLNGSTIEWGELVDPSGADGPHAKRGPKSNKIEMAEAFLRSLLATGAAKVEAIEARGKDEGFTYAALYKAKDHLKITSLRHEGAWWWELPSTTAALMRPVEKPADAG
jgi:hypothetical protein